MLRPSIVEKRRRILFLVRFGGRSFASASLVSGVQVCRSGDASSVTAIWCSSRRVKPWFLFSGSEITGGLGDRAGVGVVSIGDGAIKGFWVMGKVVGVMGGVTAFSTKGPCGRLSFLSLRYWTTLASSRERSMLIRICGLIAFGTGTTREGALSLATSCRTLSDLSRLLRATCRPSLHGEKVSAGLLPFGGMVKSLGIF